MSEKNNHSKKEACTCECVECTDFGHAPSQAGLPTQRPLDFPERRTRVRGGVQRPEQRIKTHYHNPPHRPHSRIPALVPPDCMGLLESALRILLGIQTNWTTELVNISDDGQRCFVKHPGYMGWIQTSAILNLSGEGLLS